MGGMCRSSARYQGTLKIRLDILEYNYYSEKGVLFQSICIHQGLYSGNFFPNLNIDTHSL